jgi:hypothetical protein
METSGSNPRISTQGAAASLAAVTDSRRRAQRVGYPLWFWLATGLGLGALPLWVGKPWLPGPWESVINLASLVLLIGTAIVVSVRGLRGARDGYPGAIRSVREVLLAAWPFVPYVAVLLAGGIAWEGGFWHAPLAPLATAAAAFVGWTGGGLATTTFSARR